MPLAIETFRHDGARHFGATPFKALGHPLVSKKARALLAQLRRKGPVAVFDPHGLAQSFATFYGLDGVDLAGVYVQHLEDVGRSALGQSTKSVAELGHSKARVVFVAGFDAERSIHQLKAVLPKASFASFDSLRLDDDWLSNPRRYLDPLNFATNFAFFRDAGGHHTAVRTANYWGIYGAEKPRLWLCLFDANGKVLADWIEPLPAAGATVVVDSREVRQRFGLKEFTGSLFLHVLGAKGHEVVKYALDTYGDDASVLSATHDANAWPADFYAGLPAPSEGERVVLWVQNSHPIPIPAGEIALRTMGDGEATSFDEVIPPFATRAIDVAALLPHARWPEQVEVIAGRYFVRPRYEIQRGPRVRMAHANVERTDLKPDPQLPNLERKLGKGFLLPMPIPPVSRFHTTLLPTPMATTQQELPLSVLVMDQRGNEVVRRPLGRLPRNHQTLVDLDDLLSGIKLPGRFGHAELVYDFSEGGNGDGWLHAIARIEDRATGHVAETSFGAHVFNTLAVYKDEPQSYSGPPPGLSTRLFLRVADLPLDTFCHLIYPASTPWRPKSETALILTNAKGKEIAREVVRLHCSGSLFWSVSDVFDAATRKKAGRNAYVVVRDTTCRLFGYHGVDAGEAFSLDHMFGF